MSNSPDQSEADKEAAILIGAVDIFEKQFEGFGFVWQNGRRYLDGPASLAPEVREKHEEAMREAQRCSNTALAIATAIQEYEQLAAEASGLLKTAIAFEKAHKEGGK